MTHCYFPQFNSLDLFGRSFIGAIPNIWTAIPVEFRMRGRVAVMFYHGLDRFMKKATQESHS